MTTLPQNKCDSLSLAGPFTQTIFLGCSIIDFSANAGWNEDSGTLDVRLVQDACAGSRTYWDVNLHSHTDTMADPGFLGENYDIIGSPVYFRLGNFEYSGLVQSWEKTNSSAGNPVYTVKLMDPRQLLQNAKMIVDEYAGTVGGVANIFNVYGMMESLGSACPQMSLVTPGNGYVNGDSGIDGATFGSPAGGFGGAKTNENGMPWSKILSGLNLLANCVPRISNAYSTHGRIVYKGINENLGYGLMRSDRSYLDGSILTGYTQRYLCEYFLDLSELPTPPATWRLGGTDLSIFDAIGQLCSDAGYDYYIELLPVRNIYTLSPSGIAKFIKVRTVRRLSQPSLTTLSSFIGDGLGTIDSKQGKELRNETTSSICIGGPKNTLYQVTITDGIGNHHIGGNDDDIILPYFGVYPYNLDVIIPQKEKILRCDGSGKVKDSESHYEWYFWAETTFFNDRLPLLVADAGNLTNAGHPLVGAGRLAIKLTEMELLGALAGFDVWLSVISSLDTDTGTFIKDGDPNMQGLLDVVAAIPDIINAPGKIKASQLRYGKNRKLPKDVEILRKDDEIHVLYNWVYNFASMLGKTFQVRVPYTCAKIDGDSSAVVTSENPSQTGWTEQDTICGLAKGSLYAAFMQAEDNRYNSMVVLDDSWCSMVDPGVDALKIPKDISNFDVDEVLINPTNQAIYLKVQTNEEYVFSDYTNRVGPRAVITLNQPVMIYTDEGMSKAFEELITRVVSIAGGPCDNDGERKTVKDKTKDMTNDGGAAWAFMAPLPYNFDTNPLGVAFGIKSNVMVYGPWFNVGPVGGVKVTNESSLVPWEYNGYTLLNVAGQSKADEGVTRMQVGEMGDITVPGYPTIPLGAELGALAGGAFGAGTQLIENRNNALGDYTSDDEAYSAQYGYFTYTGAWTGLYGPNITSVDVSIGTQGVQTTYRMRTYTPKFGRFAKSKSDRIRQIGQNQISFRKKFMERFGKTFVTNMTTRLKTYRLNLSDAGIGSIGAGGHTPHPYLMGTFGGGSGLTECDSITLNDFRNETINYETKAFMSFDGLIRPVSLGGDGGLPMLAVPKDYNLSKTPYSNPPLYKDDTLAALEYNLSIDNEQIQPWQNPTSKLHHAALDRANGSDTGNGHDILLLANGIGLPTSQESIINVAYEPGGNYGDDYRGLALKGPLLLHSWGYDIDGRPVPNANDISGDAVVGQFTSATSESFYPDFLRHPELWPVGPVDLRFDRERGVWTSQSPYKLLYATLITDVYRADDYCDTLYPETCSNMGIAIINDHVPYSFYDKDGNYFGQMSDPKPRIKVINLSHNECYASGTDIVASYNGDGLYVIIENDATFKISGYSGCNTKDSNKTGWNRHDGLEFGSGFILSKVDNDNCAFCEKLVKIDLGDFHLTSQTGNCSDNYSSPIKLYYNDLILGDQLYANGGATGECGSSLTINAKKEYPGINGITGTCSNEETQGTQVYFSNLIFSENFRINGGGSTKCSGDSVTIDVCLSGETGCHSLYAQTGSCEAGYSASTKLYYENLKFGDGLYAAGGSTVENSCSGVDVTIALKPNLPLLTAAQTGTCYYEDANGITIYYDDLYFDDNFSINPFNNNYDSSVCSGVRAVISLANKLDPISGLVGTCSEAGTPTELYYNKLVFSDNFRLSGGGTACETDPTPVTIEVCFDNVTGNYGGIGVSGQGGDSCAGSAVGSSTIKNLIFGTGTKVTINGDTATIGVSYYIPPSPGDGKTYVLATDGTTTCSGKWVEVSGCSGT